MNTTNNFADNFAASNLLSAVARFAAVVVVAVGIAATWVTMEHASSYAVQSVAQVLTQTTARVTLPRVLVVAKRSGGAIKAGNPA